MKMMLSLAQSLLGALLLAGGSSAAPPNHWRRAAMSSTPLPPSQDPWYTAPANFESAAPGAVLRVRAAPGNLTASIANASAAYHILYRTTNSRYLPDWAVTTLFVPENPLCTGGSSNPSSNSSAPDGATALLSYQIPYDSAAVDASPSYALYAEGATGTDDIAASLGYGWYVSVPDYEGPLASFTAGVQSGHATIDAVRAVLSSGFGLADSPDVRYAMWGYSGGALASEWAAELQVQYAPELNFAGAALGGLTPNITTVMEACSGQLCAGLSPPGIIGLASQFPEVLEYVISQLKTEGPLNATSFLSVQTLGLAQTSTVFAFQDIAGYFINGEGIFSSPPIRKIMNSDGRMGYHGVPQMPLYVYKAVKDEVSPVKDTDDLVDKYCKVGATIQYERLTIGGHSAGAVNGEASAFQFLAQVLGGTYAPPEQGCSVKEVAYNVTSSPMKRRSGLAYISNMF
ncbi:secretory lipase-domain-containing protein [Apiospora aurea]|uniref:Secretory lipase-domain-containing protein n=1 Tax=Apiospora aurea TaxID=335848 RepID=A0ABR1Q4B2_9PEZI